MLSADSPASSGNLQALSAPCGESAADFGTNGSAADDIDAGLCRPLLLAPDGTKGAAFALVSRKEDAPARSAPSGAQTAHTDVASEMQLLACSHPHRADVESDMYARRAPCCKTQTGSPEHPGWSNRGGSQLQARPTSSLDARQQAAPALGGALASAAGMNGFAFSAAVMLLPDPSAESPRVASVASGLASLPSCAFFFAALSVMEPGGRPGGTRVTPTACYSACAPNHCCAVGAPFPYRELLA